MSRSLEADLNNPNLFKENPPGEYTYAETAYGKTASGSLTDTAEVHRDSKAQSTAGGDSRRQADNEWGTDDGGHLIGARFGGSPSYENLTAQDRNLNRSGYKQMENEWAAHLSKGDKVFVNIETDGTDRPNAYMGYAIYESPDGTRTYDTFHYVNESQKQIGKWEEEAEEFDYVDLPEVDPEQASGYADDYAETGYFRPDPGTDYVDLSARPEGYGFSGQGESQSM